MNNKIIREILKNRGMDDSKEIDEFLSPKPTRTYDPFLLLNMKESVEKILDACKNNKKICLYGDYDADGITSISILIYILNQLTDNLIYFVPNRFTDGYGLSKRALEKLYMEKVELLITVDCGITAIEEVEFWKEKGLDIIVTDHHTPQENLPNCLIINPKQKECSYPFKELAGCGVAFKLAQGIVKASKLDKSYLNHILDIVAIGTIGDIVPLLDENRTIVKYGLQSINTKKKKGLKALTNLLDKAYLDSQSVSFSIVPHLNAAGRIYSAETGIKLFTSKNEAEALYFAKELVSLNSERQSIQKELFFRTKEIYETKFSQYKFPFILLDEAHEGVTGIVAGKMKDYCKKPVALLTKDHQGEFLKGTSRSIGNINIYNILSKVNSKGLFEKFGGHQGACGFTLKEENYHKVVDLIEKIMSTIPGSEFEENISFDYTLDPKDINIKLVKDLAVFEPTGHMNPKPVFKIENIRVDNISYMGKDNEHIKLVCSRDDSSFTSIGFSYKDLTKHTIKNGEHIDIYGSLSINKWNKRETVQVILSFIDLVKTI